MTVNSTCFLGVVALAGLITTGCSGPVSPTAVTQSPANLSRSQAPGASGAGLSTTSAGGSATAGGADLQVSGSASTGSPNAASSYSYTFGVKNSGPDVAAGVNAARVRRPSGS